MCFLSENFETCKPKPNCMLQTSYSSVLWVFLSLPPLKKSVVRFSWQFIILCILFIMMLCMFLLYRNLAVVLWDLSTQVLKVKFKFFLFFFRERWYRIRFQFLSELSFKVRLSKMALNVYVIKLSHWWYFAFLKHFQYNKFSSVLWNNASFSYLLFRETKPQ